MNYDEMWDNAVRLFKTGAFVECQSCCESILHQWPTQHHAVNLLGLSFIQQGRHEDAIHHLERALTMVPDDTGYLTNLAAAYAQTGQLQQARALYSKSLALNANNTNTLFNLGNLHLKEENWKEACQLFEKIYRFGNATSGVLNNLGLCYKHQKKYDQAREMFDLVVQRDENFGEGLLNAASLALETNRWSDARDAYQRILAKEPENVLALAGLAQVRDHDGFRDEAIQLYEKVLELSPDMAMAWNNCGNLQLEQKNESTAIAYFKRAIELDDSLYSARVNLGWVYARRGHFAEALELAEAVIERDPQNKYAHNLLGVIHKDKGKIDKSIMSLRNAVASDPKYVNAYSNLLFTLPYHPTLSAEDIFIEYKKWNQVVMRDVGKTAKRHTNTKTRDRRLKIGYVSPDFTNHAMQYFHEPVFANHNHTDFELYAYAQMLTVPDKTTRRLQAYFDHFVDTRHLSDEEFCNRIRSDEIDILIDLAGHTGGNRLLAMAQKPAPVQASWWIGSAYTTGLSAVDYFIGNEDLVPTGSEHLFGEKEIYRLPEMAYCYRPSRYAPKVTLENPFDRTGVVTFGCLSRTVRLNERVFKSWAEIVNAVPNSRILLDQKSFADENTCDQFFQMLEPFGLRRSQVAMVYSKSHWDSLDQIDIALDPFPHNAGCTTVESLWMGIPVITMASRPSVGRIGEMILNSLSLPEWVAHNEDEYVAIAVKLAHDQERLRRERRTLRGRMQDSALLNEERFTSQLEDAYREMWHRYCDTKPLNKKKKRKRKKK